MNSPDGPAGRTVEWARHPRSSANLLGDVLTALATAGAWAGWGLLLLLVAD